jgi:hypothetical protein
MHVGEAGRRSIRLLTGDEPITEEEQPMPRGVYERKPKSSDAAPAKRLATKPRKKRKPARPKPARRAAPRKSAEEPRFGVFDDGCVMISAPGCKGRLSPEDSSRLLAFIKRLGGE